MDTPEQPTVWPPAPTLAPPDAPQRRLLPSAVAYGLRVSAWQTACFSAGWTIFTYVRWLGHRPLHWEIYGAGFVWGGIIGLIKTYDKFKPKPRE